MSGHPHTCNATPYVYAKLTHTHLDYMHSTKSYFDDDCSSIAVYNTWIGEVTLTVEAALIIRTCR